MCILSSLYYRCLVPSLSLRRALSANCAGRRLLWLYHEETDVAWRAYDTRTSHTLSFPRFRVPTYLVRLILPLLVALHFTCSRFCHRTTSTCVTLIKCDSFLLFVFSLSLCMLCRNNDLLQYAHSMMLFSPDSTRFVYVAMKTESTSVVYLQLLEQVPHFGVIVICVVCAFFFFFVMVRVLFLDHLPHTHYV